MTRSYKVKTRRNENGYARLTLSPSSGNSELVVDVPSRPYDILEGDDVDVCFDTSVSPSFCPDFVLRFELVRAWPNASLFSAGGLLLLTDEQGLPSCVHVGIRRSNGAASSTSTTKRALEDAQRSEPGMRTRSSARKAR